MKKTNKILSLIMAMILACLTVVCVYAEDITADRYEYIDIIESQWVVARNVSGEYELIPLAANSCPTSANQMQKQVERGQAPSCVDRVDSADINLGIQAHVHFKDGSAINIDGTAHHGSPIINNATKKWLQSNGWCMNL